MSRDISGVDIDLPKKNRKAKPGWYSCVISNVKMKKGRLLIRVKKVKKV